MEASSSSLLWFLRARIIKSATCFTATSFIHLVVIAGVPSLIPEGSRGFRVSYGIIFLLHDIPTFSRAISASFPEIQSDQNTSRSIIWFSVPQDMTLKPFSMNLSDMAMELSITCRAYSRNDGSRASQKAIALARVVWSCGQPWTPGNTAFAISGQYCSFDIIIAQRGHLRVLWVVVVTISQYGIGFSMAFPDISPAIWSMSAMSIAQTSSAIWRNLFQSRDREYAEKPARISFGLFSFASRSISSISICSVSLSRKYGTIW